jgi:hypothetical protein
MVTSARTDQITALFAVGAAFADHFIVHGLSLLATIMHEPLALLNNKRGKRDGRKSG